MEAQQLKGTKHFLIVAKRGQHPDRFRNIIFAGNKKLNMLKNLCIA